MRRLALVLLLVATTAASAATRRNLTIRFPRTSLPPNSNTELCYFARLPASEAFALGSWTVVNKGARGGTIPVHFLVYLYTGQSLAGFPTNAVESSRGCLDLGPDDRDRRVLIATAPAKKVTRALPAGVALELAPTSDAPGGAPSAIGILLDVNWSNGDARTRVVSSKLVLHRASPKKLRRTARALQDRSAEAGILVAPFSEGSTTALDARWTPASAACVLGLSGQMHRRGRCIAADLVDGAGNVMPPPGGGLPNPCAPERGNELFVGSDFTDPGSLAFTAPFAVAAGQSLRYACWLDNGHGRTTVRLGCETEPGVTPGAVGAPSVPCSTETAASDTCPGNAACVPANAVAGPSVDDEVCGLTGFVYDVAPGGGCDLSGVQ